MERRAPLRRTTGLKRAAPLRTLKPMTQQGDTLKRTGPLKPGKRKRRKKRPPALRDAVRKRSHGRCVVCLHDGEARPAKIAHLHHVLPVERHPELELVAENLIGLCVRHHEQHTTAFRRVPWRALPECAVTLAYATSGAAAVFLERTYPR